MRLVFLKFCERVATEANGRWSIHGIYECIYVQGTFPCPMPPLFAIAEVEAEIGEGPGERPVEVTIFDEDGHAFAGLEGVVTLRPPSPGMPSQGTIPLQFPLGSFVPRPGVCSCELYVDGKLIGSERIEFAIAA